LVYAWWWRHCSLGRSVLRLCSYDSRITFIIEPSIVFVFCFLSMSASPSVASVPQTVNGSFVRPTYSVLSNDLLVGLLTAASAIPDLQSPVGEAFAMMLADRVPALEVLAGSTILVPVNPPIENQEINFTFMSSCPV
jgi:hypothetical protein